MKIIICIIALLLQTASLGADEKLRIYNGLRVYDGEFPHHVSLMVKNMFLCGGALITDKHVITAAHCVISIVKKDLMDAAWIEVGSVTLGEGQTHLIKRIHYHAGYEQRAGLLGVADDIAVVHLKVPVVESKYVRPIKLPAHSSELAPRTPVYVSGHGRTRPGPYNKNSKNLLKLRTKTLNHRSCQAFYMNALGRQLRPTCICTEQAPPSSVCFGDSGSALVDVDKSVILGIVSGGTGRCGAGDPDVFTKVSHYINYIEAEINYKPTSSMDKPISVTESPVQSSPHSELEILIAKLLESLDRRHQG